MKTDVIYCETIHAPETINKPHLAIKLWRAGNFWKVWVLITNLLPMRHGKVYFVKLLKITTESCGVSDNSPFKLHLASRTAVKYADFRWSTYRLIISLLARPIIFKAISSSLIPISFAKRIRSIEVSTMEDRNVETLNSLSSFVGLDANTL